MISPNDTEQNLEATSNIPCPTHEAASGNESAFPFHLLPAEVMMAVVEHLSYKDLFQFSVTSKQIRNVAMNAVVKINVDVTHHQSLVAHTQFFLFSEAHKKIKTASQVIEENDAIFRMFSQEIKLNVEKLSKKSSEIELYRNEKKKQIKFWRSSTASNALNITLNLIGLAVGITSVYMLATVLRENTNNNDRNLNLGLCITGIIIGTFSIINMVANALGETPCARILQLQNAAAKKAKSGLDKEQEILNTAYELNEYRLNDINRADRKELQDLIKHKP